MGKSSNARMGLLLIVFGISPFAKSQAFPQPQWQVAAGGTTSFDVAAIRPEKPGLSMPANIGMEIDDYYVPTGGLFQADRTLSTYIDFAYKLHPTSEQKEMMFGHLPKWVSTQNFTVVAKASDNVTSKDQMRLMMRSLLADRFKLVAHFEERTLPVYALVLDKPGTLGASLRRHDHGAPCDLPTSRDGLAPAAGIVVESGSRDYPFRCGQYNLIPERNYLLLEGSRDVSLATIGTWIAVAPPANLGRPVVDQTGLTGTYDFTLEWQWVPESEIDTVSKGALAGLTVKEAVRRQLGLRLKATTARVQVLVIDHVEMPSEN